MKLFGITGGLGMGKSACAQMLNSRGVPIVDTDGLARRIVQPGQPALAEVRAEFGDGIVGPDGGLRRDELARIVFRDAAARARLEAILHPRILALWQEQVRAWRKEGRAVAAVVIPLLFETRAQEYFDTTICVACSPGTQLKRLAHRGWTPEQTAQRVAAQWSIEMKMSLADCVIWTEGNLAVHAAQLEHVLSPH
jgi:dephospho-CoA kinase